MNQEEKKCQNCKRSFTIEPEDFDFYKKIVVPPPTFCSECRMQRRLAVRNERVLYRDECDLCKKSMLSMYSPDKPFTVYCRECWYGDGWDPLSYGVQYDWNTPFFEQFRKLMERVPRIALAHYHTNVNADYANFIAGVKNVYLAFSVVHSENIYYSRSLDNSRDCFDIFNAKELEQCYENVDCIRNYQANFSVRSRECINSAFLFDCANCQNCFMSSNLRNKRYVIRNKQYSKEEYVREMAKVNLGSGQAIVQYRDEFSSLARRALHRYAQLVKAVQCTGDNIENSKNVQRSFDGYEGEALKYCMRFLAGFKDAYDVMGGGLTSELIYEVIATGASSSRVKCSTYADGTRESVYTDWCHGSTHMFGSIAVRKNQYCILNRQYTKGEYEALVPKIIDHMNSMPFTDQKGRAYRYGEFFPIELSPWAYNETTAEEFFPLTKEEAVKKGYPWRDPDPYTHQATVSIANVADDIKDIPDSIVNEIIGCPSCDRVYRIIPAELTFLRLYHIAFPRKCPDCRHRNRFALRNPIKLWHRVCRCAGNTSEEKTWNNTAKHFHGDAHCPNEFETSYAPERPEIVYCEQCYQTEVV